jgi:tetratricopeptide (TPR) repeat protein
MMKAAKTATPFQAAELMVTMRRAWDGFYPMTRDLPYELGRICLALQKPKEAARYLAESLRLFGAGPMNLMSLALAFAVLERTAQALQLVEQSLILKPDNATAQRLREYLMANQTPPADLE